MTPFLGSILIVALFCGVTPASTNPAISGTAYLSKSREKRAWTTFDQAWKVILRGTRRLPVIGKDLKLYQKNGGFDKALADFKSLSPTTVQQNNFEMFGRQGKNEIILRGRRTLTGQKPRVEAYLTVITKQNGLMEKPYRITKTIHYLSGGSH